MDAEQFDAALASWLRRQPDYADGSYHVQIKLWSSEVEMAQLTAMGLTGWVIMDWQQRGLGLSAKRALNTAQQPPNVARMLDALQAPLLHAHIQVILAPAQDWPAAYGQTSLAPDLMPVLDAGHATVLSVTAERDNGQWQNLKARQPPDDEPIDDF
jgi:hypothetical protein